MNSLLTRVDAFIERYLPNPTPRVLKDCGTGPLAENGPRDAVLVIDASPSMDAEDWRPSRLVGAKKASEAFVSQLQARDPEARVAIVAYNAVAQTLSPLHSVEDSHFIGHCIQSIRTGSFTNITAGLEAAEAVLRGARRYRQIVLLTDGQHNHGPEPSEIAGALRMQAILECVGIGGSPSEVDELLLKAIASTDELGRKRYRWIGDSNQLVRHFRDLGGGLSRY